MEKITKDDMTQLKSFANPPPSACVVMEGVCIIFQADVKSKNKEPPTTQDYWEFSKKFVLNEKLIKKIKDFKVEQIRNIPQVKMQKLKLFAENPLFDKERVFNASKAAGNLSLWIRAVLETYDAIMIIEPKKEQLAEAQNQLAVAEEQVQQKQKALEEALEYVQQLQKEYEVKQKEKEQIQAQVDDVQEQLTRAEKLTNGLANEKASWILKAKDFKDQQASILGNCMLCSAIISYMGVFPQAYRTSAIDYFMSERRIQFSHNFSIQHILCDPLTISDWTNNQNLPNDSLSIENAIILKNSTRWPLMIDPQLQAIGWIKSMESNIMSISNEYQLENAITIGYAILIEIGENIDPLYEPVLQQKII